jgi:hypothetical protein
VNVSIWMQIDVIKKKIKEKNYKNIYTWFNNINQLLKSFILYILKININNYYINL